MLDCYGSGVFAAISVVSADARSDRFAGLIKISMAYSLGAPFFWL